MSKISEANKHFRNGSYQQALSLYQKAVGQSPFYKDLLEMNIGLARVRLNGHEGLGDKLECHSSRLIVTDAEPPVTVGAKENRYEGRLERVERQRHEERESFSQPLKSGSADAALNEREICSIKNASLSGGEILDTVRKYNKQKEKRRARVAVYTAIIGGYDELILPEDIVLDWDYILFSDAQLVGESIYELRAPEFIDSDPVRVARYVKTHPHTLLSEYDYTIWIDGNILLKRGRFKELVGEYIDKHQSAVFRRHPDRDCFYKEISKCKELLKDDFGLMSRQLGKYRQYNIPELLGLYETNVIFRSNRCEKVNRFNEIWWDEISNGSRRDQLSVMPALYKVSLKPKVFPEYEDIRSPNNDLYYLYKHSVSINNKMPSYVRPDFYALVRKSNQRPVGYPKLEVFENHYSTLRVPYKVKKILLKTKNLGFYKKGRSELESYIATSNNDKEKAIAKWFLGLILADSDDMADIEKSKFYFTTLLKSEAVPKQISQHLHFMLTEVCSRLGGGTLCPLDRDPNAEPNPDSLIQEVSFCSDDQIKLEALNRVFDYYGMSRVRAVDIEGLDLYDRIFPERPFHRDEHIRSDTTVSVILPCFNASRTIETTIFSLLGQTWLNLELIAVDDCSSDDTFFKLQEIARFDSRLKVIRQEKNMGPYVARNLALSHATGELVTVADSDDWNHPQKIELQVKHLLENEVCVANVACWVRASSNLTFIRRGSPYYKHINISSLMFKRKEVLGKLGCWDEVRFGADGEFYKRLIALFGRECVVELDIITSIGRVESGSLTNNEIFGYDGFPYGARKEYLETYEAYHRECDPNVGYFYEGNQHPKYPVPEIMKPDRDAENTSCDRLLAGDFRVKSMAHKAIDFIESCKVGGYSWGVFQINSYDVDPRLKVHESLRSYLLNEMRCMFVYGESVTCREAIVFDAELFCQPQNFLPSVISDRVLLIKRNSLINESIVMENVKGYFSGKIKLIYESPLVNDDELVSVDREVGYFFESIIVSKTSAVQDFVYKGSPKIAIVMPCIDEALGLKTAKILVDRAGIECTVIVVMDDLRKGFIHSLNSFAKKTAARFIVYVAQDAFPGRNWLKIAYDSMEESNAGLLGFNDGKWAGRIASFGMVRKSWISRFYDGDILSPHYKAHKADNEITVIAKLDGKYFYCPESVLVEVDYAKDKGGSNLDDDSTFKKRFSDGFDSLFSVDHVKKYAKEYKVKL